MGLRADLPVWEMWCLDACDTPAAKPKRGRTRTCPEPGRYPDYIMGLSRMGKAPVGGVSGPSYLSQAGGNSLDFGPIQTL